MVALDKQYTDEEFDHLCFEFGIELDDVTSEYEITLKAKGEEAAAGMSKDVVYKIDVPANRYDLLCIEGISRALRIFLETEGLPQFKLNTPSEENIITFTQTKATKGIRQFVVGAVLRDVTFTPERYASFMDLQDKLHKNIGRGRTLIAIGTHDLDTVEAPFTYDAKPQTDIKFQPLSEEKTFNVTELFEYYDNKPNCHLTEYLAITRNHPVHPVILDKNGVVMSLPPIINGEHSKIKLTTKNVFIECTGTDFTKLNIVLNIMVSTFAQYCADPFSVEKVAVVDGETGVTTLFPNLDPTEFKASTDFITNMTGIPASFDGDKMAAVLGKMSLPATHDAEAKTLTIQVPVTRPDILHQCDIAEDVAIAYGYNNLVRTIPNVMTIGAEQPLNQLSDLNRGVLAECGYSEVLTWILTSHKDNFENLNQPEDPDVAVILENPCTDDFQEVRVSLLSGLLKVVSNNLSHVQLPIKIFEVGDIVKMDSSAEVGATNNRRSAALYAGTSSGFEEIWSVVDRVMAQNGCDFVKADSKEAAGPAFKSGIGVQNIYYVKESANVSYFPGRRADIYFNNTKVGSFGIVHPTVLDAYNIKYPCSAFELNLEAVL